MWVLTLLLLFLLAAGARAQTASPTAGPASSSPVLLYWESTPYTASELNSYNTRSAMNGICSSDPQYSENKCAYGFAVIGGISGESSIANCVLPGTSTPISCTDPVYIASPLTEVAYNWTSFINGPTLIPMNEVGPNGPFFAGFAYGGAPNPNDNCDYWTSVTGTYTYKLGTTETADWLSVVLQPCDNSATVYTYNILCACIQGFVITESPSKSPSRAPSKTPTVHPTGAPSIAPGAYNVYVYATSQSHTGNIGVRSSANAFCAAETYATRNLSCSYTWALLGYSTDGISNYADTPAIPGTKVTFSPDVNVWGPTGFLISDTWAGFYENAPNMNFIDAQFSYYARNVPAACIDTNINFCYYWWGVQQSGALAYYYCSNWQTGSNMDSGWGLSTGTIGGFPCSDQDLVLCGCLSSYVIPTGSPSRTPSKTPSKAPVTSAPSQSPTPRPTLPLENYTPIVFQTRRKFTGSQIGSRAQSTRSCETDPANTLSCAVTWMMVGYYGELEGGYAQAIDPVTGEAFSSTKPVFSPSGAVLASNWSTMMESGMLLPPVEADINNSPYPYPTRIWSGIDRGGFVFSPERTCVNWTSSSYVEQAVVGETWYSSYQWHATPFGRAYDTCDHSYPVFCACLSTVPATFSPTKAPGSPTESPAPPSRYPTLLPTAAPVPVEPTSQPSTSPTIVPNTTTLNIVVFATAASFTATVGSRATTSALCLADTVAEPLQCNYAWALMYYTGQPQSVPLYPINTSFPIYSNKGVLVAENWNDFVGTGSLTNDLASATDWGPNEGTGTACFGGSASLGNCNDWTSNSVGTTGMYLVSTSSGWYDGATGQSVCGDIGVLGSCSNNLLCVCLTSFAVFPSASPTHHPTTGSPFTPSPTFFG